MKKHAQIHAVLAAVLVLVLASACGGSKNSGNSGDQPDYAATEASLSATQDALSQESSDSGGSDKGGVDTSSSDTGSDTQPGEIDFSNVQSGDVLYTTEFDVNGDWEDGWFTLVIPSRPDDLWSAYMENGFLYITVGAKATTVYAIYDPLFMPRDEADVLVETAFDNIGDRNNNISVMCRVTEDGWYEFSLSSSGLWFIWRYDAADGSFNPLFNGGVPNYNKNITDHVISATCIGDELTFYLDGEMLKNAQVHDRTYRSGSVGLSVYADNVTGVEVEFDWFEASVP